METTYIVLIILTVIYVPLWFYVRFGKKLKLKGAEKLEEKGIGPYGPTIMIRTKVGFKAINYLGQFKRFWRVCGILSRIVTIVLMTYIVSIIVLDLILLPQAIGKGGMGIEYALAIPGLNPMLPIVYGWIGLIIAMVFHELAHGIQSRANDISVDSTGLLYAVVPVGAFVEPNEDEIEKASRGARMDLYAAGITMNTIIAAITFILMFAMMSGGMVADHGDSAAVYGITSDSPALDCDIPATSIILEVNGEAVDDIDAFYKYIDDHGYGDYNVTFLYKGDKFNRTLPLGTFVNGVVKDSPASKTNLDKGDFIISFQNDVRTVMIGSTDSFTEFVKTTEEGQTFQMTYYDSSAGHTETEPITLGDNNGVGYVGVTTTVSGMSITTPNLVKYTGIDPYFGCETLSDYANNTIRYIAMAFNGFSPVPESTQWWYHNDVLSDDIAWILISALYWIFWLNIVLGVTNALPAVPFDGGFLFAGGVDFIAEKFIRDEKKKDTVVNAICSAVTYFMLLALVLVLVVIIF